MECGVHRCACNDRSHDDDGGVVVDEDDVGVVGNLGVGVQGVNRWLGVSGSQSSVTGVSDHLLSSQHSCTNNSHPDIIAKLNNQYGSRDKLLLVNGTNGASNGTGVNNGFNSGSSDNILRLSSSNSAGVNSGDSTRRHSTGDNQIVVDIEENNPLAKHVWSSQRIVRSLSEEGFFPSPNEHHPALVRPLAAIGDLALAHPGLPARLHYFASLLAGHRTSAAAASPEPSLVAGQQADGDEAEGVEHHPNNVTTINISTGDCDILSNVVQLPVPLASHNQQQNQQTPTSNTSNTSSSQQQPKSSAPVRPTTLDYNNPLSARRPYYPHHHYPRSPADAENLHHFPSDPNFLLGGSSAVHVAVGGGVVAVDTPSSTSTASTPNSELLSPTWSSCSNSSSYISNTNSVHCSSVKDLTSSTATPGAPLKTIVSRTSSVASCVSSLPEDGVTSSLDSDEEQQDVTMAGGDVVPPNPPPQHYSHHAYHIYNSK